MLVQPYLSYDGRCSEAIDFYRNALGAQVQMIMRFGESPDQSLARPEMADKVMHASLKIGDSVVMMSDGDCNGKQSFGGFSLTISTNDENEARRIFDVLSTGGQVQIPLQKTFFSPAFGMAADRFGVSWMVMAEASQTASAE